LGLDLGITSIGWALVNVDDENIQKMENLWRCQDAFG
jgi:CRISPR/Cas system Type II protein with McrA/HNH and RuvC-like nuclease domain